MIRPTWDEWFVREVEGAAVDDLTVWYLGATGFVVRTEATTVYVDPYFGIGGHRPDAVRMCPVPMDPTDTTRCDAVLVTHEHADHMHPPSYAPLLAGSDAALYAPETCLADPDYEGDLQIAPDRRTAVSPGDSFEVGDLTVRVLDSVDPDAAEPVSYLFEHPVGTFYHGGDTKDGDHLAAVGERFDVTLAALALGTVGQFTRPGESSARPVRWYMDGDEMVEAATALRADRLVPTHYDLWKGFEADPKSIHDHATSFAHPRVVEVVRVGDRLDLSAPGVVPPEWAR